MTGMSDKQVLESLNRDTLRDLGLGPKDAVPRILPTKLVTSRKPEEAAPSTTTTSKKSSFQEAPWRAKVRLCACGNFEADDGSEVATQNVCPQALRIMGYQLSTNREWIGASGDVSLAFLNSDMLPSDIVLLEPPSALKRLGLVPPGTI